MWIRRRTLTAALAALVIAAAPTACIFHDDEPEEADDVHVVEEGETIFSIAQQYEVSVDALLAANPDVDPQDLRVGQRLQIPDRGPTPDPNGDVHVIEEGETLFSIAQRYDVSVDAILDANPEIDDHRDIRVGLRIRIPTDDPADDRDDRLQPVTRVEGRMTDEGVTCPAMRGEDDTLYTLIGHDGLDGLEPGDRIYVEGTEPEASICQQGTTLQVTHLERR